MSVKILSFDNDNGEDITGQELTDIKHDIKSGTEKGTWINEKRVPLTLPLVCLVPHKILIIMRSVEKLVINSGMGTVEVGLFLNGKMSDDGKLILSEEFYIPKQKVSCAAIDFEEEPPNKKFN